MNRLRSVFILACSSIFVQGARRNKSLRSISAAKQASISPRTRDEGPRIVKQHRIGCFALALTCHSSGGFLFCTETLRPVRTATPSVIDDWLDDSVWRVAPGISGFKTYHPDCVKDMTERTKVRTAYDSEPDKIKSVVTSRDNNRADDWVCRSLPFLLLESFVD